MGFFGRIFGKKTPRRQDIAVRYAVEADILPHLILGRDGLSVVAAMLEKKSDFFVELFSSQYVRIYSASDFSVKNFEIDANHSILEVEMPEPEVSPLCEKLIIAVDSSMKVIRYLTVEKGFAEGPFASGPFLCEWKLSNESSEGRMHLNYGNFSQPKLMEILEWS